MLFVIAVSSVALIAGIDAMPQLGLEFESEKAPVSFLVIASAQEPVENEMAPRTCPPKTEELLKEKIYFRKS